MHTFFSDIVLNIGGKRISSNTGKHQHKNIIFYFRFCLGFHPQIYTILNRVGTPSAQKNTIQIVEGGFEDQDGKTKFSFYPTIMIYSGK